MIDYLINFKQIKIKINFVSKDFDEENNKIKFFMNKHKSDEISFYNINENYRMDEEDLESYLSLNVPIQSINWSIFNNFDLRRFLVKNYKHITKISDFIEICSIFNPYNQIDNDEKISNTMYWHGKKDENFINNWFHKDFPNLEHIEIYSMYNHNYSKYFPFTNFDLILFKNLKVLKGVEVKDENLDQLLKYLHYNKSLEYLNIFINGCSFFFDNFFSIRINLNILEINVLGNVIFPNKSKLFMNLNKLKNLKRLKILYNKLESKFLLHDVLEIDCLDIFCKDLRNLVQMLIKNNLLTNNDNPFILYLEFSKTHQLNWFLNEFQAVSREYLKFINFNNYIKLWDKESLNMPNSLNLKNLIQLIIPCEKFLPLKRKCPNLISFKMYNI